MTSVLFTNHEQLEAWLSEHNYFFEGYVDALQPRPSAAQTLGNFPTEVSFDLSHRSNKNFYAGSSRTYFRARCIAQQVTEWLFTEYVGSDYELGKQNIDQVELDASSESITLLIDNNIRLNCGSISVKILPELLEPILPMLSNRTVVIRAPEPLPTPAEWIACFTQAGCDVSWRRLGDIGISPESVPQKEYEGWFLQETNLLNDTQYGLMFSGVAINEKGFSVVMEAYDCNPNLWKSLSAVAGGFPNNSVICGNCLLRDDEWSLALERGSSYLDALDFSNRDPARGL